MDAMMCLCWELNQSRRGKLCYLAGVLMGLLDLPGGILDLGVLVQLLLLNLQPVTYG